MNEYQKAQQRLTDAQRAMDEAQAALDKAEDEWHQACRALDEMENEPLPTFKEMRGIFNR